MPLTDAEIDEKFADLFAEAIRAFRTHPEFVIRMAESAAQRLHPEQWAEATRPTPPKPQPLSTINTPEARDRARELAAASTRHEPSPVREQKAQAVARKRERTAQRNAEIIAARGTGATYKTIAEEFSLSTTGVRHILAREN